MKFAQKIQALLVERPDAIDVRNLSKCPCGCDDGLVFYGTAKEPPEEFEHAGELRMRGWFFCAACRGHYWGSIPFNEYAAAEMAVWALIEDVYYKKK